MVDATQTQTNNLYSKMPKPQGSSVFQPSIEWTQDPQNHVLRLQLPGFQKDDLSVQIDCFLTVTGKRSLDDGNYIRLAQLFEVPKDSHFGKIRGKFDGVCLSLFMPKNVAEKKEALCVVSLEDERRKGEGMVDESLETIRKNIKVFIAGAVAGFSIGFLLAQELR